MSQAIALLPADDSHTARRASQAKVAEVGFDYVARLARRLTELRYYTYARRLARVSLDVFNEVLAHDPLRRWLLSKSEVISTYKDPEVAAAAALALAKDRLRARGFAPDSSSPLPSPIHTDVLCVAAAIARRSWEANADVSQLRLAYEYYRSAFAKDVATANGYPAVNAAFVLDLVAWAMRDASNAADSDDEAHIWRSPRSAAQALRLRLVQCDSEFGTTSSPSSLADENYDAYWRLSVRTEAYFGLGMLREAADSLALLLTFQPECDLYLDITLRQLGVLARIRGLPGAIAGLDVPNAVVSTVTPSAESPSSEWLALLAQHPRLASGLRAGFIGKVGIALSGGGGRAALFHVGVLARLAELDLLRHVETLSCVSGGSIVGALYYLYLKQLLETKTDRDITRDDYVALVARVATQLSRGLSADLRTSLLADAHANLRAASDDDYSRTHKLGRLIEEHIFGNNHGVNGDSRESIFLNGLFIDPPFDSLEARDVSRPFNPKLDNWRRHAKVPTLIINAATLNTGHVWQFTASWMGEPPMGGDARSRSLPRLRRIRFGDSRAMTSGIRVTLGEAVAASAAVPSLFEPLVLRHLYRTFDVSLADGGVHDNQGVASLLDQGCTSAIVSDASGQLRAEESCVNHPLGVGQRANDILMSRVRDSQYALLDALHSGRALNGVLVTHLRLGLDAGNVSPAYLAPRNGESAAVPPYQTAYGVWSDVQQCLAELRTDLDAFHLLESFALMESGYRMAFFEAQRSLPWVQGDEAPCYRWHFRAVSPLIGQSCTSASTRALVSAELAIGANQLCKLGRTWLGAFWRTLLLASGLLGTVALLALCIGADGMFAGISSVFVSAAVFLLGLTWPTEMRGRNNRVPKSLWDRISGRLIAWVVSPVVDAELASWRRAYLERGRLSRFL